MQNRIDILSSKILVGYKTTMSLAENKTAELWSRFRKNEHFIQHKIGTDLFSLQEYDAFYFSEFSPNKKFTKWALTEVCEIKNLHREMVEFHLNGGLYAVFDFVGDLNKAAQAFEFIFMDWLPKSDFILDQRPHFERLGEKYQNNSPKSEEEIWIPIKWKN